MLMSELELKNFNRGGASHLPQLNHYNMRSLASFLECGFFWFLYKEKKFKPMFSEKYWTAYGFTVKPVRLLNQI